MFRRTPFVYDVMDLWPDTLSATGMFSNSKGIRIVDFMCNWMYRRAAHITVLAPGIRQRLLERGVPDGKITVIYNWCGEDALDIGSFEDNRVPPPSQDRAVSGPLDSPNSEFTVLFAGTMGKAQGLEAVLMAAKIVQLEDPKIRFIFVGGGIEVNHLKQFAHDSGLSNVTFLPRVPAENIGPMLRKASALVVHLKNEPLFEITIPSKSFIISGYLFCNTA